MPLRVSAAWLEQVRQTAPELPAEKRNRFIESYGLREYDAQVLTSTREISDYFEKVAKASGSARKSGTGAKAGTKAPARVVAGNLALQPDEQDESQFAKFE